MGATARRSGIWGRCVARKTPISRACLPPGLLGWQEKKWFGTQKGRRGVEKQRAKAGPCSYPLGLLCGTKSSILDWKDGRGSKVPGVAGADPTRCTP